MNTIYKILIVLCILLILHQCVGIIYIKMTHLSKTDLEWIKYPTIYEDGAFVSNTGERVKMTMMGCTINNDSNPFHLSSSGNKYKANADYSYIIDMDQSEINGRFSIAKSLETDSLVFSACLNRLCTQEINVYPNLKSIELKGKRFNDCLIIDKNNAKHYPSYPEGEIIIDKFVISKKYGLIYYHVENGKEYYRNFKN